MCVPHPMLQFAVLVAYNVLCLCGGVTLFPFVHTSSTALAIYKVCV